MLSTKRAVLSICVLAFAVLFIGRAHAALRQPDNPPLTDTGLSYKYYEYVGSTITLSTLELRTCISSGIVANFSGGSDIRRTVNWYALLFKGYIDIPADDTYTFTLISDDGALLYIGTTTVVDNDGVHGSTLVSGSIDLKAGKHEITVPYFQDIGGSTLQVMYESAGIARQAVADSMLSHGITTLVSITPPDMTVSEGNTEGGTFVISRNTSSGTLFVPFVIGGSAVRGTDYVSLASNVLFAEGQSSATVTILPIDNTLPEKDRVVTIAIPRTIEYGITGSGNVTMTIHDDDSDTALLSDNEVRLYGGENGYVNSYLGEKMTLFMKPSLSGTVSVKVYDLVGKLVWQETVEVTAGTGSTVKWDCAHAASGIYLVHLKGDGIDLKKKIAVVR